MTIDVTVPRCNLRHRFGSDPWLAPYIPALERRRDRCCELRRKIVARAGSLAKFALAHEYFGLHRDPDGDWVFREWAPAATRLWLRGDFNGWRIEEKFAAARLPDGVWELRIPAGVLEPGMNYMMMVAWPGGEGERIPAFARRVVQDPVTGLFSARVAGDDGYRFCNQSPPRPDVALIYEAHIGMSGETEGVAGFADFRERMLPRIVRCGYNTVQLMAVMSHPYYGSFGYHVGSFFAVADRFGTPEEFKRLVDAAHGMGLRVTMDIVHSHAVRNERDGLGAIDGTQEAYFHAGERGVHPAWDSYCFNYGKPEVLRFLLSNCRYWLEEFQLDGFRFDGVTSMLYTHHGLGRCFGDYSDYFGGAADLDAAAYLTLANELIHELRPDAVTVAEDVSGMPGVAAPVAEGGLGFDYRLAMGVTDYWFRLFDIPDEQWSMTGLFHELVNRRADEHSISYVESHDQALVGGKSAIFTLADAAMYDSMHVSSRHPGVDRAMALHKMIRLATAATADSGYLNFMGNEFGHPEWIDFPRKGNNWSYAHARRLWSLADAPELRYRFLAEFDRAMIELVKRAGFFSRLVQPVHLDDDNGVLIFERSGLWFCFNFHPTRSLTDYRFEARRGEYRAVLDSDDEKFGGFGFRGAGEQHGTLPTVAGDFLSLYLPCRSALVLERLAD